MFSRNTQSTRKSWCSAEYSSQHLASKRGAWRLPFPFSVWSRDSRARQVCKIPQKAFKGPRTEGSKPHMQSSHYWIFACLKVSISFRLEAMQFCVTSASSSMGAELPQNSSWKFVDLSPKFILGTTIWVTSHPQPQTTAATKRLTVNYCGYLTIPLPPPTEMPPFTSHSAFSVFVRREVQCHCKWNVLQGCPLWTRQAHLYFRQSQQGIQQAHRSPLSYSSWGQAHSSGLQVTAKP